MRAIWMCMVWFLFGFMVQFSLIKVSLIQKTLAAHQCSNGSLTYSEIMPCYNEKQATLGMSFLNWFNPSDRAVDNWFFVINALAECAYGSIEENDGSGKGDI